MRRRYRLSTGLALAALLCALAVWRHAGDTGPELRTSTVGMLPTMVAVDARAGHVFVVNSADKTLSVLDAASGILLRTVALGHEPDTVAVDERTRRVFVLSNPDNVVLVLDSASGALLHTVTASSIELAVDTRAGHLLVAGARLASLMAASWQCSTPETARCCTLPCSAMRWPGVSPWTHARAAPSPPMWTITP